jgi:hypothetical protein
VPKNSHGTIIVTPNAAITLTSGAGTNDQTKCINVAITTSHLQLAVEELEQRGLPAGVTGSFSGGVYTINGVPQQVALFLIQ